MHFHVNTVVVFVKYLENPYFHMLTKSGRFDNCKDKNRFDCSPCKIWEHLTAIYSTMNCIQLDWKTKHLHNLSQHSQLVSPWDPHFPMVIKSWLTLFSNKANLFFKNSYPKHTTVIIFFFFHEYTYLHIQSPFQIRLRNWRKMTACTKVTRIKRNIKDQNMPH